MRHKKNSNFNKNNSKAELWEGPNKLLIENN